MKLLHRHHDHDTDRDTAHDAARDRRTARPGGADDVRDQDRRGDPAAGRHAYRDTQAEMFGGIRWGAAFFGWLVATGLAVVVTAVLAAAGVALGLTDRLPTGDEIESTASSTAGKIGIGGAIGLVVVLFVAYLAGGYVAGRMARFDGAGQGLAVWLIGLVTTVIAAIAGLVAGSEYNVLNRLDLPRIPVEEGDATAGGVVTLVAVLVLALVGAVVGGRLGERYHRRIDRRTDEAVAHR